MASISSTVSHAGLRSCYKAPHFRWQPLWFQEPSANVLLLSQPGMLATKSPKRRTSPPMQNALASLIHRAATHPKSLHLLLLLERHSSFKAAYMLHEASDRRFFVREPNTCHDGVRSYPINVQSWALTPKCKSPISFAIGSGS